MVETIERVDALIHPDYNLRYTSRPVLSQVHILRRDLWDQRVDRLADDPKSVLLYFSTYLIREGNKVIADQRINDSYREDMRRIRRYSFLLGNRLLLFAGSDRPSYPVLQNSFHKRGLAWQPDSVCLTVYGEYFDRCVEIWGDHLKVTLGVTDSNYTISRELSLPSYEDVNAGTRKLDFEEMLHRAIEKETRRLSTEEFKSP